VHSLLTANQGHHHSGYELEALHSLATSVGSRVNRLTCRKAIDRYIVLVCFTDVSVIVVAMCKLIADMLASLV